MQLSSHPAPGIHKLPPGFFAVRHPGVGDILTTQGFAVPDRDMQPSVDYRMGIGDILQTQGFLVPDRVMNPVANYVSGTVKPLGVGCCSSCASGSINGIGVGDIAADFAAIQSDFTSGNYMGILSAPIMGIPYALPLAIAAAMILPGLLSGGGGRRRR
jgi:hypothetical protein